ncbi:hypothetical protein HAX54_007744 [Datura stramonium]|uniref:Secreted protein n=1 Tax=Datura stramonium TaxID=4076 RepID=A0ABS8RHX9_DATST|nr:hypothetical protein [Datura stramonium]
MLHAPASSRHSLHIMVFFWSVVHFVSIVVSSYCLPTVLGKLQAMLECFLAGRETNVQTAANVPQTTSTYSDSQNHVIGHRIVVPRCAPLPNAQLEDRNIDSQCGSPLRQQNSQLNKDVFAIS